MIKEEDFYRDIDLMVKRGASYLDAIVEWCESRGIEVEVGAELVAKSPLLLSRIQLEAEDINLLKKDGRLPL
jgi:hypothetical protein